MVAADGPAIDQQIATAVRADVAEGDWLVVLLVGGHASEYGT
jgi:hypothetical protein